MKDYGGAFIFAVMIIGIISCIIWKLLEFGWI